MKVYLFYKNNGVDYDGYEEWVSKAFLVPDDFSEEQFKNEFVSYIKSNNLLRFTKNGSVFMADTSKFIKLYEEYFSRAFEEIKIYGS